MPEASPDRRNRWYRVSWPDQRHLKPAWAEKYFDNHSEAFDYYQRRRAEHPTGRVHRPVQSQEKPPPGSSAWIRSDGPGSLSRSGCARAVKRLVLNAVSSPSTRTMYGKALEDFFSWRAEQGNPPFNRAAVQAHRAVLESKGYAPSTINQRLAAVKKLAHEAAANGLARSGDRRRH